MASGSLWTRSITMVLFFAASLAWLLVTDLMMPRAAAAQSAASLGDANIYPKPYPAPALPAAGGSFTDPTFGTRIIRITDASNAPNGASVNSAAVDSMFNADGSMFYLLINGVEWSLYSNNKSAGTVTRLGTTPGVISMDGAPWHPTNPNIIYGISVDTKNRKLYEVTVPAGTSTLLHNFDAEIPAGGYPSSRVQISPDARYFAVTASSFAGQDNYDYVAVWDRQTNTSRVLNIPARFGAGTYLHSMEMDNTGQYIRLGGTTNTFGSVFWRWQDNIFSTSVIPDGPDYFGGHKIQGASINLNQGQQGDAWLVRNLATPHATSTLLSYPRKNGMVNWYEDSHASRVLPTGAFFDSRYFLNGGGGPFSNVSGAVYQIASYLARNGTANFAAPDTVRYGPTNLTKVSGVPSAPAQYSYNVSTDTFYVWLPDSSNPQGNAALHIGDWRPMMEEIVQLIPAAGGTWTWQRIAHHRTHYTDFTTGPRGNASPNGTYVLFQSNWDGSPRVDVFLAVVPAAGSGGGGPALPPPSNLVVK
jgi:hypothetical protein